MSSRVIRGGLHTTTSGCRFSVQTRSLGELNAASTTTGTSSTRSARKARSPGSLRILSRSRSAPTAASTSPTPATTASRSSRTRASCCSCSGATARSRACSTTPRASRWTPPTMFLSWIEITNGCRSSMRRPNFPRSILCWAMISPSTSMDFSTLSTVKMGKSWSSLGTALSWAASARWGRASVK